jgi:ArsR family transcriptional regulator
MASSLNTFARLHAVPDISREELFQRLGDRSLLIADVLPKEAYDAGHIPGAINLPLAELEERAPSLLHDRDREIAVYCASFT